MIPELLDARSGSGTSASTPRDRPPPSPFGLLVGRQEAVAGMLSSMLEVMLETLSHLERLEPDTLPTSGRCVRLGY